MTGLVQLQLAVVAMLAFLGLPSDACEYHLNGTEGKFNSPNYPNNYNNYIHCYYIITAPQGKRVLVDFTDFDLELSSDCRYDYIQAIDGPRTHHPTGPKYCGTKLPPRMTSTGNVFTIFLKTDHSGHRKGFMAKYYTFDAQPENCVLTLTGSRGTFKSPGYPMGYFWPLSCVWTIRVEEQSAILLTFKDFSLPYSTNCKRDHVEISENVNGAPVQSEPFCGKHHEIFYETSGNTVEVRLNTKGKHFDKGFTAEYITVKKPKIKCDFTLTEKSGTITFPNSSFGADGVARCKWKLVAVKNRRLTLSFKRFEVAGNTECSNYYFKVVDGPLESSPNWQRICGSGSQPAITSVTDTLHIIAKIKTKSSSAGFSVRYLSEKSSLYRYDIVGTVGQFSSEQYPDHIPQFTANTYFFPSCGDQRSLVTVKDFDLPCDNGLFTVSEGKISPGKEVARLCGEDATGRKFMNRHGLTVEVSTTNPGQHRGVLFSFARCGATAP